MLPLSLGKLVQTHNWRKDKRDKRDYIFEKHFPIKSAPKRFRHEIEPFIDCGYILACVSCALTTVNSWHHKKQLSWRYLYAKVPHLKGGTRFRDNAKWLEKWGQPLDRAMPQEDYKKAENQKEENKLINAKQEKDTLYRSSNYYFLKKRKSIKTAIMMAPLIVGLKTDKYWHDYRKPIIKYCWWLRHYQHAIVIYGWEKDYWLIIDCRGKKKRKLHIKYPLLKGLLICPRNIHLKNNN